MSQKISLLEAVQRESFKALIFDLDGTLADTMPVHYEAWHIVLKRFNYDIPDNILGMYKGQTAKNIIKDFNRKFGWKLDPLTVAVLKEEIFLELIKDKLNEITHVADVARFYRDKSILAIATGGKKSAVNLTLKNLGFDSFFTKIVTADDGYPEKINPDYYIKLCNELGISISDAIFFEDSMPCLEAASKAGLKGIYIEDFL